jgi:hypothetical protein
MVYRASKNFLQSWKTIVGQNGDSSHVLKNLYLD